MATTEHTINDALAEVLKLTRSTWRNQDGGITSENTGTLRGSNRRPDILVIEPNVSPVVVETEVLPAATVEIEARSRLGEHVLKNGRPILSALAVRLPARFRSVGGAKLVKEIQQADDLEIAIHTGSDPTKAVRWPQTGWLTGSVATLSLLIQSAAVPPDVIDKAADELVAGVQDAAGLLEDIAHQHPAALEDIAKNLYQKQGLQTRRMAATILANAFVFQETLANGPGDLAEVKSAEQLRGAGKLTKAGVLAEWRRILTVNYWPIFDIARRILEALPTSESRAVIDRLADTADRLLQNQIMRSHDLTGAVFQQLIADRKFLAAYYTTPSSAALLAGLAIDPIAPGGSRSWSSIEDVKSLRIADFACGTGTLLSTVYQRIGQLHELAGGDAEALHPHMMSDVLIGCDVLPAAAHLTASMLAGAHPTVRYKHSSILTVAYGRHGAGVALGALDLLNPQATFSNLSITAKAAGSMGESEKQTWSALPHASFDLVIMNPPFTRDTGHEGKKIGVSNPMFAAFGISKKDQQLMAKATKKLTEGTSAHGNAGEASIFLVLADRKLKIDGTLALVAPLSLVSGDAWEDSRKLIRTAYSDVIVASIAGFEDRDMSFSADTDMGECLVVARKTTTGATRALFVVLSERPAYPLSGSTTAEHIRRLRSSGMIRRLEDGPAGGTAVHFGNDLVGHVIDAPLPAAGGWHVARIADLALAQTAFQLEQRSTVWLPSMEKAEAVTIPMTTIGAIATIGPYHADVSGNTANGGIRGPFEIVPLKSGSVPTYPVLWSHDADRERCLSFATDHEGVPRQADLIADQPGVDFKVNTVWKSASHCHFNQNFRFNSQSTAMQFTTRKTMGGRAWLSLKLASEDWEKVLVLWGNTSLGLLMHWWHANKQQSGRGSIGKAALHGLPTLDVAAIPPPRITAAKKIFDDLKNCEFQPLHELGNDACRRELDERFCTEVLDLPKSVTGVGGSLGLLRAKLMHEPSIRGGKQFSDGENTGEESNEDED